MLVDPGRTRWRKLLQWLQELGMDIHEDKLLVECKVRPGAGYGLFAMHNLAASTLLFRVPSAALININTLSYHYPTEGTEQALTAIQLISLHLFLHRPGRTQDDSTDPLFGPYLSILPRDFENHPLTWLVKRNESHLISAGVILLEGLPPSVSMTLEILFGRFWTDWDTVRSYMQQFPQILRKSPPKLAVTHETRESPVMHYLWAWLNVNTRCVYHRLKPSRSDPDNLTLCPIFDFANHTQTGPHMLPAPSKTEIWKASPCEVIANDFTLFAPHDAVTLKGNELYLTYGQHSNRTLFVEYGFVDKSTPGEVDVQDIFERLLEHRGKAATLMKELLQEEGYWGQWTLHLSPTPAHPSYRLITALRLYNLPMNSSNSSIDGDALQLWRDTVLGKRHIISPENEDLWRGSLSEICVTLTERAAAREGSALKLSTHEDWIPSMQDNIRMLWEEESIVAMAVAQSVINGEEF